jgi:hypothetical protein
VVRCEALNISGEFFRAKRTFSHSPVDGLGTLVLLHAQYSNKASHHVLQTIR